MHVFSRRTKKAVATFPDVNLTEVTGTYSQVTGSKLYHQHRMTWVPRPHEEEACESPAIAVILYSSGLVSNKPLRDPCAVSAEDQDMDQYFEDPCQAFFATISFAA